ncbi:O-antigen ligase family protein [Sinomonas terrae]|uniref:O-antigen ligase family protein n=1 Tax=Sinomonas terrae TaxID=2908838 RepID=A0ABS9U549_9MICC|nr:O-antigen ligase family protein [Sinomonas terrae]MCH6471811.1 O-antigen ligase family protein [Sinomonas terrae]
MTALGMIFAGAYAIALFGGRRWVLLVLASSISFNDSIVMALGTATITPFYLGLIVYLLSSFTVWRREPLQNGQLPGRLVLIIMFIYCSVITAISPVLFAGLGVISAADGIDQQVASLTPLGFTSSNLAQVAYLLLNVIFVLRSQRDGTFGSRHLTVGFAIGALVACSSFIGGAWPHAIFDNSPRGFYTIETGRLRGQFSEPSHLGAFAVAASIYFGARLARVRSLRTFVVYGVLVSMALTLLIASASGTAAVGLGAALLAMLAVSLRTSQFKKAVRIRVPVFLGGIAALVALIVLLPSLFDMINTIVQSKFGSVSLTDRTLVDQNSITVFLKTFLLGAGDGSNRGSSLLLMLLSQIGLVGTALFLRAVSISVFRGLSKHSEVPAALALIGFLSSAFVSLPDFASPILWALIAVTFSSQQSCIAGSGELSGFGSDPQMSARSALTIEVAIAAGRTMQ